MKKRDRGIEIGLNRRGMGKYGKTEKQKMKKIALTFPP